MSTFIDDLLWIVFLYSHTAFSWLVVDARTNTQ